MAGDRPPFWASYGMMAALLLVIAGAGAARWRRTHRAPSPASTEVEGDRVAASVITIAHKDVEEYSGLKPRPTRSKQEAHELADKLARELTEDPTRFEEVARMHSEDPVAHEGGALPDWKLGEMAASEPTIMKLAIGQVGGPVATEYGYRIFRRDRPMPIGALAAKEIVVAWKGAQRAPASVTRTKDEALSRAKELAARASKEPAGFDALARAESDGWDRESGGFMGVWLTTSKRYPVAFNRAIANASLNGVGAPVESLFGFHVFLRIEPTGAPPLAGAHILIAFKGAERAPAKVVRTRDVAKATAEELVTMLKATPDKFGSFAREQSDDATAASGGDLGSWKKGDRLTTIDDAFVALKPGEIGGPVETPFGFHVLLRNTAPGERGYGE